MQEVNGRWYLYLAHLWHRGWSILDVTDPASPEFVTYIPGPENTWTIQIQVADGKMITALERIAPGWGGVEGAPFSEGFLIWDVADPIRPLLLGQFHTGASGTHLSYGDDGGGIILDISDVTRPQMIGQFLPERRPLRPAQSPSRQSSELP